MQQYTVTGMSCAACSSRVEKAVSKVAGVSACSVSLLTNSMGVEGTASAESVIAAVEQAGYHAEVKDATSTQKRGKAEQEEALMDHETPVLRRRLIASVGFLLVLMYVSMGHCMWGWPMPAFFEHNPVAIGLVQMILAAIVMTINQKFFINGVNGILHRAPNMDTLVALGSAAAFGYSTAMLFAMTKAQADGGFLSAHEYIHEFYFEAAAMILALITVGKMLEARSKGKTTDALKGLMKLAPKTVTLWKDGKETVVPVEQMKKGDLFVVRPGEAVPVDGIILEGSCAVNEAALTGESIPADKKEGDAVSAGTINQSGFIRCEATRVGEDTTLSQIIKMVSDAAATKAPIAKVADTVSGVFVPVVIGIALVTIAVWLLCGESFGFALARGISVLVISCPCALGLATPVAIMVGSGMGAKNGILFKTAVSLEQTGKVTTVVLDKTGTITAGEPRVTDLLPVDNYSERELLQLALNLESKSEHPLARAVLAKAQEEKLIAEEITEFRALPGNGLSALQGDCPVYAGNASYISEYCRLSTDVTAQAETLASEGKTPLFFAQGDRLVGVIAVADVIKEDSPQAVKELQNMGIRVMMLTGDNEHTAKAIGAQAGVDEVIAGVLPDGKESVIRKLKQTDKVAMVGDGINDAPALTRADIGIAIGAGADVAVDAADVVLMKSRLSDVPAAIRLSRATLRNIHENLFWAFIYNTIGIPLAAGIFIPVLGWQMNPMFGAAAMSLSSFCVVSNALRLNFFKLYSTKRDKKRVQKRRKEADGTETLHRTIKVKGMMCEHCEARVKKALESLPQVESAEADHKAGTVDVVLKTAVDNKILKQTIEHEDYKVLAIKTEERTMIKITLGVEGMKCVKCEAHMDETVRKMFPVEKVTSSHENNETVLLVTEDITDEKLQEAVASAGYTLTGIARESYEKKGLFGLFKK